MCYDGGVVDKISKVIGVIIGIALVPALIAWGVHRSQQHDEEYPWKASIFLIPNSSKVIDSKDVKTLEECRAWVRNRTKNFAYDKGEWDYSCGRDCEFTDNKIVGGKRVNTFECAEITK